LDVAQDTEATTDVEHKDGEHEGKSCPFKGNKSANPSGNL
jgi:hypothetical protein